MLSKYVFTFVMSVGASVTALAQERSSTEITAIGEAYKASKENLISGSGIGMYEVYASPEGRPSKLSLKIKADVKVYFDRGKFHIRLDYKRDDIQHLTSRVIVYDGTAILVNRVSKNIRPAGSEGDIYEAKPILPVMRKAGFDYNPCELPAEVLRVDMLQKQADDLSISRQKNGDYSGTFNVPPVVHCTFLASHNDGYNIIDYREFNTNHNNFQHVTRKATWERKSNLWYVKSIDNTWLAEDGRGDRVIFRYSTFDPNVDVSASLFKYDSLSLEPTARVIDRRPSAEEPVLRQTQRPVDDEARLNTLADSVKSLTPSNVQRSPHGNLVRNLLLATGLLLCIIGLSLLWWKKSRKQNLTPEM